MKTRTHGFKSSLKHWFLFQNFTFSSSLNHTDLFLVQKIILAFHIHCNVKISILSWIEKSLKVSQNGISLYYYRHLQSVYIVEQRKCCIGLNNDFFLFNLCVFLTRYLSFSTTGKQQGIKPYEGKK